MTVEQIVKLIKKNEIKKLLKQRGNKEEYEFVTSKKDMIRNTRVIDKLLDDAVLKEYSSGLVKRGRCFLVIKKGRNLRFYPSRFMGYKNNNKHKHTSNFNKDGRKTNKAISEILGHKPQKSEDFELELIRYCAKLGVVPNGFTHKFWEVDDVMNKLVQLL